MACGIESVAARLPDAEDEYLTWFLVTYSGGAEEHRKGTLLDASELASTSGLVITPTHAQFFRWVRRP